MKNGDSPITVITSYSIHYTKLYEIVTQANDHGLPLALSAAKSPLRKEIQKLAHSIAELTRDAEAASATA